MTFNKIFDKRNKDVQTSKQSDAQKLEQANSQTSKQLDTEASKEESPTPNEEQQDNQTIKHPNIETSKQSDGQTSKAKSKNQDYTRTTFYLPKKTHQRLKIAAINEGEEMSEIVTRLIEDWLEQSDS